MGVIREKTGGIVAPGGALEDRVVLNDTQTSMVRRQEVWLIVHSKMLYYDLINPIEERCTELTIHVRHEGGTVEVGGQHTEAIYFGPYGPQNTVS